MAIAALVLWMFAAGAGIALLLALGPAHADTPAEQVELAAVAATAAPLAADPLKPPPTPHARVTAGPGDHPLLEFSHPALGITGLALWLGYVVTRNATLGWIAFAVAAATILAGAGWLAGNARAAKRHGARDLGPVPDGPRPAPPYRLIAAHGLIAITTFALAVVTLLSVAR